MRRTFYVTGRDAVFGVQAVEDMINADLALANASSLTKCLHDLKGIK
jgi:hypothetical protein